MKRSVFLLLLGVIATANGFTGDKSLLARVTVYWAHGGRGADRYTRQHKSATGLRLQQGHCAVDPKKIPYGSRVVLPDGSALSAVDTGSAVRNRKAARRSGRTTPERNAVVIVGELQPAVRECEGSSARCSGCGDAEYYELPTDRFESGANAND